MYIFTIISILKDNTLVQSVVQKEKDLINILKNQLRFLKFEDQEQDWS